MFIIKTLQLYYMNNTVLQIPLSKDLRLKSEKAAEDLGFSSLQEVVRVFLSQLSRGAMDLRFETPEIQISKTNEKRYLEMVEDYKINKDIMKNGTVGDFFDKLNK